MSGEWTVVIRGGWYLPHLVNMLNEYRGNGEQTSCRDEVVAQIESQIIRDKVGHERTRPIIVIDVEDREQVERLTKVLIEAAHRDGNVIVSDNGIHPDTTAAALREFASPKPPKPEEPTGWGAVVEASNGWYWTLIAPDSKKWANYCQSGYVSYADLDVVRVVTEGVQP